jgi:hypothetical protein
LRDSRRELVGGNDKLSLSVATHTVDGARDACAHGVAVTTRMLGRDSDRPIRAANNGTLVVKRIRLVEVDDETGVFGPCRESDSGTDLYAERFVGFGTGDTRRRCGVGALARLISMMQGEEADPHVLVAAQVLAGLAAEQTSFLILLVSSPTIIPVSRTGKAKRQPMAVR